MEVLCGVVYLNGQMTIFEGLGDLWFEEEHILVAMLTLKNMLEGKLKQMG